MMVYPFYVTFGQRFAMEVHPTFGKAHPDGWVTIMAPDYKTARLVAYTNFGTAWADLYDEEDWDPRHFPAGELARLVVEP